MHLQMPLLAILGHYLFRLITATVWYRSPHFPPYDVPYVSKRADFWIFHEYLQEGGKFSGGWRRNTPGKIVKTFILSHPL